MYKRQELGCGKGTFIARLAAEHPEINYLAIDMKSVVLASAVKNIEQVFQKHGRSDRNVVLTAYDIEDVYKRQGYGRSDPLYGDFEVLS